jgi:hypothetical protein
VGTGRHGCPGRVGFARGTARRGRKAAVQRGAECGQALSGPPGERTPKCPCRWRRPVLAGTSAFGCHAHGACARLPAPHTPSHRLRARSGARRFSRSNLEDGKWHPPARRGCSDACAHVAAWWWCPRAQAACARHPQAENHRRHRTAPRFDTSERASAPSAGERGHRQRAAAAAAPDDPSEHPGRSNTRSRPLHCGTTTPDFRIAPMCPRSSCTMSVNFGV